MAYLSRGGRQSLVNAWEFFFFLRGGGVGFSVVIYQDKAPIRRGRPAAERTQGWVAGLGRGETQSWQAGNGNSQQRAETMAQS